MVARLSGTHLHLCFDGSEPRASVHLVEDGDADFHLGAHSPHEDLDVSLVGNVLLEHDIAGVSLLPAVIGVMVLLGLLWTGTVRLPVLRQHAPCPTSILRFRPPSRAPPA